MDRVLVWTLVPLWAIGFALALKVQVEGGGFLWVALSEATDDYPALTGTVAVLHPPDLLSRSGLEAGDQLVRLGELDLRGLGTFGFISRVRDASEKRLDAPLVFAREGTLRETTIQLSPVSSFRPLLAISFAFPLSALLLALRSRPSPSIRAYLLTGLTVGFTTCFFPGSRSEYLLWLGLLVIGATLVFPVCIRFWFCFPDDRAEADRWHRFWPWLIGLPTGISVALCFTGWMAYANWAVLACCTIGFLAIVAVATNQYRLGDLRARRQMKWILFGLYCAALPAVLAAIATALDPTLNYLFLTGSWAWTVFPFFFLLAVASFNLYDVDRLLSATAAYNVLAILLVAAGLALVPRGASAASALLGIDPGMSQVGLSLALAATRVPAQRRLRPQIERVFFRERHAFDHGIAELMQGLAACGDSRELTEHLGSGLVKVAQPENCVIYAIGEASYSPVFVEGRAIPPAFEASSPLISTLREGRRPLALDSGGRQPDEADLGPFDRAALEALEAQVIVPIRRGEVLAAFLCLGPRSSGDVYTSTDVSLLTAVGETTAQQLERLDQQEVAREALAMRDELRRYVPGAIADHIERGDALEAGEREVSVLFVDIRGYTALSEGTGAQAIFSTINHYTQTVSEIVSDEGGSVVEFNGDGMMAVFGAPSALADKERAAVRAGRRIARDLEDLEHEGRAVSIGIGIATGPSYVGSIQAADRLIWSAIGNTTNLAARLQGLARELGASIVIDAATHEVLEDAGRSFRSHPQIAIRGRSDRIDVFALPGRQGDGSAASASGPTEGSEAELLRRGDIWSASFAGRRVDLQDSKGLHYLARLLAAPRQEFHVLDLVAEVEGVAVDTATGGSAAADGLVSSGAGSSGDEILDDEARAAYRARLSELREELEEAAAANDLGRSQRAQEEIEFLERELSAGLGLGGQARRAGGDEERARKAVYNRIRHVSKRLREIHPDLAAHLDSALRTGTTCSYRPEHPVAWRLS
jgi:class 3 adenylate cyclase